MARLVPVFLAVCVTAKGQSSTRIPVFLDFATQGDWQGRYGRDAYILCAMGSPWSYRNHALKVGWLDFGPKGKRLVRYQIFLGERTRNEDRVRNWIHWPQTEDPRVLINPINGERRQASWDDHGEAYPWGHPGSHLYITFALPPEGRYWFVSFYFVNKDGHEHVNRYRDYLIWVKKAETEYGLWLGCEKKYEDAPALAVSRVHDFWNGVYARFLLDRRYLYTVKIDKTNSNNATCSGVFFDRVRALPEVLLNRDMKEKSAVLERLDLS